MTVVSSFSHLDMDPGRSSSKGVALLRSYLEYAATGGTRQTEGESTGVALNDFEQAVSDALTQRGYRLLPQWGASRYRIDLVAQHPERPGEFVLAVECDGATYHSSYTARDRDRLRQQHLEALGWRFHRIWSTDWFVDRESEVARFEKAFRDAVAHSERMGVEGRTAGSADVQPGIGDKDSAAKHPSVQNRRPRPKVPRREPISEYSTSELDQIVRWVMDDSLKTDDEVLADVIRELGFWKKGSRIVATVRASIDRIRSQKDHLNSGGGGR